ncbi:Methylated-DNA--protein-cysteine methyltransferase, constitutive [Alienimonas californiensis]|uniref:methylated-DNA--[protein]-cysteine S-methyltransferase n=1 Tax=Alienimonas californiensis TaxID=2527989 RepID=A0A517PFJ1_9PLAN|nr:Methylated-DNA--protein-cysteine methyltransferase, constitutive [Alienimonas californiensis]
MAVHCFATALGWFAVRGSAETATHLTIGHAGPEAALAAMRTAAGTHDEDVRDWRPALTDALTRFAAGEPVDLEAFAVAEPSTPFARRVVAELRRVPRGETVSYAELAARAGSPRGARAVGGVMRSNRTPLLVPCHRVVGAGGRLGGFSAPTGIELKKRLLALEAAPGHVPLAA